MRSLKQLLSLLVWSFSLSLALASCGSPSGDAAIAAHSAGSSASNAQPQATGGAGAFDGSAGAGGSIGSAGTTVRAGGMTRSGSGGAASGFAASNNDAGAAGGTPGTGGATAHHEDAGMDAASPEGATTPTFHVFLLLGQSNMAGYPKAQDADKVKDERIKVLGYDSCAATGRQQDTWDVAVPPLHECWNGAIGPGDYFAKTLIGKIPAGDTIGLVPCAISGEKIETFLKDGGTKYDWIVQRAKLAQQAGGIIEGILFHQGESNNGDATWPGKVNTLVTDLRTDLALGNVPFLAGELAYDGACAGHNTLVNMLPAVVSNAYVVSASGLALDPADTQWHLHFGHDSQVMFGQRYAAAMIEALHW